MRPAAVALLVGLALPGSARAESARAAKGTRAPILTAMQHVVDRLAPSFLSRRGEGPRASVADGVFGLGTYTPRGRWDWGMSSPPLQVLPRAGLGASLNLDPVTGKYF